MSMIEPKASETDARSKPLREREIKALVLNKLIDARRISRQATLASELSIFGSKTRADLAILGRYFIGIEVKSEFDSLKRLDKQLYSYCSFFDHTILVVASRHLKELNVSKFPRVEIWAFDGANQFKVLQNASCRSRNSLIDYRKFMTARERIDLNKNASKKLNTSLIRKAYLNSFNIKFQLTSAAFWETIGARPITPECLQSLSRFRAKREAANSWLAVKAQRWNIWLDAVTSGDLTEPQSFQVSSVSYNPEASP